MKKLLVAFAALLVASSAFAQGTINFNNRVSTGDARVTRPDGTTGAGAGVTAALYLGNTMLTPTTTFRTTAAAAFFVNAVEVVVPGVAGGGTAAGVTMRAWETAAGSYEAAQGTAFLSGSSAPIDVAGLGNPAGAPPTPAANLLGLQGFQITAVPEPSTIALGVLGAAALLLRRRK